MSKIVFPDNNSAFPRTLPFSFPLITDMASDVGCTMKRMVWLQRCGKQKTTGNAISVMLFHTAETEQQEIVLFSSVLWLKDPYPLFLLVMSKWQVAVGLHKSPRQDPATALSFCSYGNLFQPSCTKSLAFTFSLNGNLFMLQSCEIMDLGTSQHNRLQMGSWDAAVSGRLDWANPFHMLGTPACVFRVWRQ